MNIDDLAAYLSFAEHLNFTKAAEERNISQPALFVKVRSLAQNLGVSLYTKKGRSLTLTREGEELARFARDTLRSRDEFLGRIQGVESTQVTLAAGAGSYRYLLGQAIRNYQEEKLARLKLEVANREQVLELLHSGRCDLGVTVLTEERAEFNSTLIRSVSPKLVVSQRHPLARRKRLKPKDLSGLAFILPPVGSPWRDLLSLCFRENKVKWNLALEATGWELMMHFASLELGVTIVNGCCEIPADCRAVELAWLPAANYYLLAASHRKLGSAAQRLQEIILATADNELKGKS